MLYSVFDERTKLEDMRGCGWWTATTQSLMVVSVTVCEMWNPLEKNFPQVGDNFPQVGDNFPQVGDNFPQVQSWGNNFPHFCEI